MAETEQPVENGVQWTIGDDETRDVFPENGDSSIESHPPPARSDGQGGHKYTPEEQQILKEKRKRLK